MRAAKSYPGIVYCGEISHAAKGKQGITLHNRLPGSCRKGARYGVLIQYGAIFNF